ncbi:hypothetical protein NDU88_003944 [Pleurodeles waltl]|uniref:Uncharacterized protein n=1 Tax=Pleurodeles waltl TaxID=8319 RepID=A0AAV7WU49_PLEWA|nr:hypothetical protein NDU88_003944 [Pleurodeles waltl]
MPLLLRWRHSCGSGRVDTSDGSVGRGPRWIVQLRTWRSGLSSPDWTAGGGVRRCCCGAAVCREAGVSTGGRSAVGLDRDPRNSRGLLP